MTEGHKSSTFARATAMAVYALLGLVGIPTIYLPIFSARRIYQVLTGKRAAWDFDTWTAVVVVCIMIALVAIALPGHMNMMRKNAEGKARGRLGIFRGLLQISVHDRGGAWPETLDEFSPPELRVPYYHDATSAVAYYPQPAPRDTGGWGYYAVGVSSGSARVFIDCTHTDTKGAAWTSY